MFLIATKNGLVIAPDYQTYFSTHEECHDLMRARGFHAYEYEICPVVFSEDL